MSLASDRIADGTIGLGRLFTSEGVDPYDEVVWERRDARITNWVDGLLLVDCALEWLSLFSRLATRRSGFVPSRVVVGCTRRRCRSRDRRVGW